MVDATRDVLLAEYAEVANNFRLLTDIRFKLLAFLPIAAAAAAALKGVGAANTTTAVTTLGLSVFGLVVTVGLMTYNARNDQLYNALVGRAAEIERRVGLQDGAFAHRPHPWFAIRLPYTQRWPVAHGNSVALIYGASIALWLFEAFYSVAQLVYNGTEPDWWVVGAGLAVTIAITLRGGHIISRQRQARQKEMRAAARRAVELASQGGLQAASASDPFLKDCAGLLEGAHDKDAIDKVSTRASFYATLDAERLAYYIPPGSSEVAASYFVALITDLSPRWVLDCFTQRRETASP